MQHTLRTAHNIANVSHSSGLNLHFFCRRFAAALAFPKRDWSIKSIHWLTAWPCTSVEFYWLTHLRHTGHFRTDLSLLLIWLLVFVGVGITWTSDSEIPLESVGGSVFLGLYILSLLPSSESDSVEIWYQLPMPSESQQNQYLRSVFSNLTSCW